MAAVAGRVLRFGDDVALFVPDSLQPRGALVPGPVELDAAVEKRGGHARAVVLGIAHFEQAEVVLPGVHAALGVALERRLADRAVAEIEDQGSRDEMDVADAGRTSFHVSGEYDAV